MNSSIEHSATEGPQGIPEVKKRGKGYLLSATLELPTPLEDVFEFFSKAENLERLTPGFLKFRVLTKLPIAMHTGALIDYRISLHGVPLRWRTEITEWNPPYAFTDEQLRGPYLYWVHRHTFESMGPSLTKVHDEVRYAVLGGDIVHRLFVQSDLLNIFTYRTKVLRQIFSKKLPVSE